MTCLFRAFCGVYSVIMSKYFSDTKSNVLFEDLSTRKDISNSTGPITGTLLSFGLFYDVLN
jgi:hypothetical protein